LANKAHDPETFKIKNPPLKKFNKVRFIKWSLI
jgi:hypothetical protein